MRYGVALILAVLACAATAASATAPPIRPATAADDRPHPPASLHVLHEWWSLVAMNPSNGDYLFIRRYARPTPAAEVTVCSGGVPHGERWPLGGTSFTIAHAGKRVVFDSDYVNAGAHIVLTPTASGVTVGPWQLPTVGVAGPPPIPVAGTLNWSAQVPAGRTSGWVEVDGRRTDVTGWRGFYDHVWGAIDRNWFHGDFAVRTTGAGETWALFGVEPATSESEYRWKPDDAKWRGVLVHARGSHSSACVARVKRGGWFEARTLGDQFNYLAPRSLRASCGGTSISLSSASPAGDAYNGIFRTGGPSRDRGGFWLHTTPQHR